METTSINTQHQHQIESKLHQTPVAIIGMASLFPKARTLQEYWENIVGKVDCITDVPASRWSIEDYYDPDPTTPDKTYCKRGGFIPDIIFEPLEFGLPPNILEVTDISQLLALVVAKAAMEDAGYGESRNFSRERTGVVLGVVGGAMQLLVPLTTRLQSPVWEKVLKSSGLSDEDTQKIIEKIKLAYVGWEENSFPGLLANVVAGRIANRLDLGGINCIVDAACASSLSAVKMAVSELVEGRSDMMITGGVEADNSMLTYMSFSKTPAFSKKQQARPFDVDADGMIPGEGIGMLVLKRLKDAERDRDRIYAVIKGIGTSSDGRYKSIYAPRLEGQIKALQRAYSDAGFPAASSVGLIEAHGTGTVAGDLCEFSALNQVFSEDNPRKRCIALGSVKSQIGHTKAAAGAASLIKTALALHHKLLPPTINVTQANPKFGIETSPFYLNTKARPWLQVGDMPRRAGVSAFGFGGTNFHVVLEEYGSEQNGPYRLHAVAQSVLMQAQTPAQLLIRCQAVLEQLQSDTGDEHYAELVNSCKSLVIPIANARLGFTAMSLVEASELLQIAIELLKSQVQAEFWNHPRGIYYRKTGIPSQSKVVALFPGQGSQYLEMGRELTCNFPPLRQAYSSLDNLFIQDGLQPISQLVFHSITFENNQKAIPSEVLQRTENAQPAIGAFSVGLYRILQQAGFKPDFVAGHSFGELTALWAAEVLSDADYFYLVKARGQAMAEPDNSAGCDPGAMLAVMGDIHKVQEIIRNLSHLTIANFNSPNQIVLSGARPEIAAVQQVLSNCGYSVTPLPVSAAFHTPFVSHACQPFTRALRAVNFNSPKIPVYSNVTGTPYPTAPEAIQNNLEVHLLKPVLFQQEIESLFAAGSYYFVEVGPRQILTKLVESVLGDRPHLAVALNASREKDSDRQLRQALMQLRVAGLPLRDLDPYQNWHYPKAKKFSQLNVRLNGSNYVSEKTKAAFEKGLQNGHRVELMVHKPDTVPAAQPIPPQSVPIPPQYTLADDPAPASVLPIVKLEEVQPMSQSPFNGHPDGQHVLGSSLERCLKQFYNYQSEILHVHEQYLRNQAEYSQAFFQLMQQQSVKLAASNGIPQGAELAPVAAPDSDQKASQVASPAAKLVSEQQTSSVIHPNTTLTPVSTAEAESDVMKVATPATAFIDTKGGTQVQVLETHPFAQPSTPPSPNGTVASLSAASIEESPITRHLLDVVSENTGYPTEMLEIGMDLESDLGIDSIKRVQIIAALQELLPDLAELNITELVEQRTLGQISVYLSAYLEAQLSVAEKKIPQLSMTNSSSS